MKASPSHPVVSQEEWLAARKVLLAEEKELTRHSDAVNAKRRALPWVKVTKDYLFECPQGKVRLADLFGTKSQLIVHHFMFAPGWEAGCVGCSHSADHVDGARQHFEQADVAYVAISRAPLADLEAFKKRMGWTFDWLSSGGSDFNFDYHVAFTPDEVASGSIDYNYHQIPQVYSDLPGYSVFYKDEAGNVYHTYSTFARGLDILLGSHHFLDLTPKGRQNDADWLDYHDLYGKPPEKDGGCNGGSKEDSP